MDRISSLPDQLINRIVSFLPLEDAIRTSTLSRRWSIVSSSLTNFEFDQSTFERKSRRKRDFKDFVNQILVLQDGLDIDKFSLSVDLYHLSPILLNSWLSFAVDRKVKEINIHNYNSHHHLKNLPACICSCNTLLVLNLNNINLELPRVSLFPKLKALKLVQVRFIDMDLTSQLFSSCPLLEELIIKNCYWGCLGIVKIIAPNLKILELLRLNNVPDIEISARNLRRFRCFGHLPNISFETLFSLIEVDFQTLPPFDITVSTVGDLHYQRASYLLLGLQNVKRMALHGFFVENLTRGQGSLANLPTIGFSVEHFHLDIHPAKNQVQVVILLLRSCSSLKHLRLSIQHKSSIKLNMEDYQQLQEIPRDGLLKSLLSVDIEGFEGSDGELDLVRFLLENAGTMEKMNITYSPQKMADASSPMSVNEAIGACNKASPSVVVSLN